MSQTTTPSGADVLAFCNAEPRITRDGFGHQIVAIPLWKWQEFAPAVAALITRNAELEAQTPSALREKLRSAEEALRAVEAENKALREDSARLDYIEEVAKSSRTGVSFDWCRYAEDGVVTETGYRIMRHHSLGPRAKTLRAVIDAARS